jgi:microcystin-dependent protein
MKDHTIPEVRKDAAPSRNFWERMQDAWKESAEYVEPTHENTPQEAAVQETTLHETQHEEAFSSRRGSQPYVGEICIFAGTYAPYGWELCHGQIVSIAEYETLYTLVGTTYGGNGQDTFALPDLRGRIPVHKGNGFVIGEKGGTETVALTANQMPTHSHTMVSGVVRGTGTQGVAMTQGTELATLTSPTSSSVGSGQAHENMSPFLGLNFIISLYGVYPQSA